MKWAILVASLGVGCGASRVEVTMNAENNSGQDGLATLTAMGSKVRLEIDLQLANDQNPQVVHVHTGPCGDIGGVVSVSETGAPIFLNSLEPRAGRMGSTTDLEGVRLSDLVGRGYAINAHYSQDITLYTSCGNIP